MWRKMRFSKLEMKFVEFSFLLTEYKIISGGIRKVIYWSLNWYMYKFIRVFFFSDKLLVLFFFLRGRLDIAQKFPNDGRASHNKVTNCCIYELHLSTLYLDENMYKPCLTMTVSPIEWHFIIHILKVSVMHD